MNPIRARRPGADAPRAGHYCEKISPGCAHCYASRLQPRFGTPTFGSGQYRDLVEPFLDADVLREVMRRRRPTRYFWCDMSDMFGAWVPDEWIDECFSVMGGTPQHTHQVLTKRPERMLEYMSKRGHKAWNARRLETEAYPPRNVWLGVSVEDQQRADERIPLLLQVPAAVRFISAEPLLGPVDLRPWLPTVGKVMFVSDQYAAEFRQQTGKEIKPGCRSVGTHAAGDLDWVIVGGESGPGARPCDLAWLRSVVAQCRGAGVPCFVKQLGSVPALSQFDGLPDWPEHVEYRKDTKATSILKLRDKKGGDPAEWAADLQVREFPKVASS